MTMPRQFLFVAAFVGGAAVMPVTGARQAPAAPVAQSAQAAVVQRYCVSCHSRARHSGNVVLEQLNFQAAASAETLERMVRKLRSGTMPPPGSPRPDPASYERLRTFLETSVDRAAAEHPNPGRRPAVHR